MNSGSELTWQDSPATTVAPLSDHMALIPALRLWLQSEWPQWYGPGGSGDAGADLHSFAQRGRLPVGLVAFDGDHPCGIGALKAESIPGLGHFSPWAACGYVRPELRRRGVGRRLLMALEEEACAMRFPHLYCLTSTSESLLVRLGWELLERVVHDGRSQGVFRKTLGGP